MSRKRPFVYVFKVSLIEDENIWRRIAIRGSQTLDDLHWAIFDAFDREEEHPYCFYVPPPGETGEEALQYAVRYFDPEVYDLAVGAKDAGRAVIGRLGLRPGQVIYYEFDFGDQWWHKIVLESVEKAVAGVRYPRVLERHGESPPQYPWDDEDEDDFDEEEYEYEDEEEEVEFEEKAE